jgi:hypothetical protein
MNDNTIISQFLNLQDVKHPLQSITDLSLKDALYLISLIRSSAIIYNEGHVGPIASVPPLAPNCGPDNEVTSLNYLLERNLITLSTYSLSSVYTFDNNKIEGFDYNDTKWKVHIENFEGTLLQLNEIIANSSWPLKWRYDIKSIWL